MGKVQGVVEAAMPTLTTLTPAISQTTAAATINIFGRTCNMRLV
jgi:hypothetical protein